MSPLPPPPPTQTPTAPSSTWRIFAMPALIALVGYVVMYGCDRHLRVRRGPWQVTYARESDGTPALRIHQESLGISNITVRFDGETSPTAAETLPVVVRFDDPDKPVPFGILAFHDLMYQPGTVVLQCFGHEVQMLPKALYLNRVPHAWTSEGEFRLTASNKPASLAPPKAIRSPFGGLRPGPQLTNDSRY
ncbi:MAG: hypothetical protein JNK85_01190 [Verrucomicrobiales bacterium]|nr:hypothetical protein [Verrucomicrobiales bacterium]